MKGRYLSKTHNVTFFIYQNVSWNYPAFLEIPKKGFCELVYSLYTPAPPPLFFDGTLESGRLAFLPQVSEEGRGWEWVGCGSLEKPASVAWNAVRLLSSAFAAAEYVEYSELWTLLVSARPRPRPRARVSQVISHLSCAWNLMNFNFAKKKP